MTTTEESYLMSLKLALDTVSEIEGRRLPVLEPFQNVVDLWQSQQWDSLSQDEKRRRINFLDYYSGTHVGVGLEISERLRLIHSDIHNEYVMQFDRLKIELGIM